MDAGPMYTLARGEQRYGPYTLDQLREYSAAGSIQPADLVWTPGMATWSRVDDLLGQAASHGAPPPIQAADSPARPAPKPPSLHWVVVLLLAVVTWGLFALVWMFVHAVWIRRIDPKSKALYVLAGGIAFLLVGGFISGLMGDSSEGLELLVQLVWLIAVLVAYFDMRAAIEVRYDLDLSGILTFFFNVLYLQYHMRRIAKGEHTPRAARMLA